MPGTDPGRASPPRAAGTWEGEEAMDVEWAHAIAPGAHIILIECDSDKQGDLFAGVAIANRYATVVSMSWGGPEFQGETDSN